MLARTDFLPKKENKKLRFFGKAKLQIVIYVGVFTMLALIFGQLVFANNLATDGEKLANIEDEIQKLQYENTSLRMQIAKETSLAYLSQVAQKEGFSRPAKIVRP